MCKIWNSPVHIWNLGRPAKRRGLSKNRKTSFQKLFLLLKLDTWAMLFVRLISTKIRSESTMTWSPAASRSFDTVIWFQIRRHHLLTSCSKKSSSELDFFNYADAIKSQLNYFKEPLRTDLACLWSRHKARAPLATLSFWYKCAKIYKLVHISRHSFMTRSPLLSPHLCTKSVQFLKQFVSCLYRFSSLNSLGSGHEEAFSGKPQIHLEAYQQKSLIRSDWLTWPTWKFAGYLSIHSVHSERHPILIHLQA